MTYATAQALRMALEQRLLTRSQETGVSLDRLRRRVVFERVVARLQSAEPGRWVLKGGMALEVRLHDRARLTKDLDLGLRDEVTAGDAGQGRGATRRTHVRQPASRHLPAHPRIDANGSRRAAELARLHRRRLA